MGPAPVKPRPDGSHVCCWVIIELSMGLVLPHLYILSLRNGNLPLKKKKPSPASPTADTGEPVYPIRWREADKIYSASDGANAQLARFSMFLESLTCIPYLACFFFFIVSR